MKGKVTLMSAKDTKKVVYLDARSIEELQVCRKHFRLGSQWAAVSRVAQIVIHEAAEAQIPPCQVRIRPLLGPTEPYHFVLGQEGQERLERLTDEYAPVVLKEPVREPGDRRFRFTAAALLRYLIAQKAREIMNVAGGERESAVSPAANSQPTNGTESSSAA
jgi:hypothetical protein